MAKANDKGHKLSGAAGRKLTARQRQVYNLRHQSNPPVSWMAMGRELGITYQSCQDIYERAEAKLLHRNDPPNTTGGIVEQEPEKFAEVATKLSIAPELLSSYEELGRELGMPAATVARIAGQMRDRYYPLKRAIGSETAPELRDLFRHNAWRILSSIDDNVIEAADLRDRAVAAGIFLDKSLLLDGQPTVIVSSEDRRAADEILNNALEVAQSRGYVAVRDHGTGKLRLVLKTEVETEEVPRLSEAAPQPQEAPA